MSISALQSFSCQHSQNIPKHPETSFHTNLSSRQVPIKLQVHIPDLLGTFLHPKKTAEPINKLLIRELFGIPLHRKIVSVSTLLHPTFPRSFELVLGPQRSNKNNTDRQQTSPSVTRQFQPHNEALFLTAAAGKAGKRTSSRRSQTPVLWGLKIA